MFIPIRCFTCGKVLADKWEYYEKETEKLEKNIDINKMTIEDLKIDERNKLAYFDTSHKGKVLDDLGLVKICCRRHMLGNVDLINII